MQDRLQDYRNTKPRDRERRPAGAPARQPRCRPNGTSSGSAGASVSCSRTSSTSGRPPLGWREGTTVVWAGMRGAVTVAAAQTLPDGTPENGRCSCSSPSPSPGFSLLLQGGTIGPLLRRISPPAGRRAGGGRRRGARPAPRGDARRRGGGQPGGRRAPSPRSGRTSRPLTRPNCGHGSARRRSGGSGSSTPSARRCWTPAMTARSTPRCWSPCSGTSTPSRSRSNSGAVRPPDAAPPPADRAHLYQTRP